MKKLTLFAFVLFVSLSSFAKPALWNQAWEAYDQKQFAEAYDLYLQLRSEEGTSAELEFNLGNSAMRLEKPDLALAHYRVAQWLRPQDPDLRLNQRRAAERLGVPTPDLPLPRIWVSFLPAGFWSAFLPTLSLTFVAYWLLGQRVKLFQQSRPWIVSAMLVLAGFGLFALFASLPNPLFSEAVVRDGGVTVLSEPLSDAKTLFELAAGTCIMVEESLRDWVLIHAGDQQGWVPTSALIRLPHGS